jgi:hypothetical protein
MTQPMPEPGDPKFNEDLPGLTEVEPGVFRAEDDFQPFGGEEPAPQQAPAAAPTPAADLATLAGKAASATLYHQAAETYQAVAASERKEKELLLAELRQREYEKDPENFMGEEWVRTHGPKVGLATKSDVNAIKTEIRREILVGLETRQAALFLAGRISSPTAAAKVIPNVAPILAIQKLQSGKGYDELYAGLVADLGRGLGAVAPIFETPVPSAAPASPQPAPSRAAPAFDVETARALGLTEGPFTASREEGAPIDLETLRIMGLAEGPLQ